ncbi:MAG: hypothetical protein ACOC7M_01895 [Chloroflexota bacterium]
MDDTAFFYSRALRIIVALAIIIPLVGIGALVWYFASDVPEDTSQEETASPFNGDAFSEEETEEEAPGLIAGDATTAGPAPEDVQNPVAVTDDNPLKPIGPKASDRVGVACGSCAG